MQDASWGFYNVTIPVLCQNSPMKRTLAATALLSLALYGRSISEQDILRFQWIADAQISPDGKQIAYTLVKATAKGDNYDTSLWIVDTAGAAPRPLTSGNRDASARWSPDGKRIAFVRNTQIYILPMTGGEARAVTDMPKGAAGPVWSPDGTRLAFSSKSLPSDLDKKTPEEKSDVRVITRAVYRSNGEGYNDPERPSHIWVVDAAENAKPKQITTGRFSEQEATWSRDGHEVYFVSNRVAEPYYQTQDTDVYVVSASGGDARKVADIDGPIRSIALSPDGSRLAFVGAITGKPVRSYSQPDLWVTSVRPGSTPKNLTEKYDNEIGGQVGGDQHPPRGGTAATPFWSPDGRYVHVVSAEEGRTNLKRIDTETGKVEPVTKGDHDLLSYTASADRSKAAILISTPTNIGDLYALDVASGQSHRLTNINEKLWSEVKLTEPEMIWYNSFDGKRIQAWVQRPPNFDSSKKYPMILNIHGGPHAAYGYTFDHEIQWMAAKGYVVLYPNPRGSTSYGQDFANIIQFHYPGDDHKDLMAGVDELIKRGWVDPEKLGVTGGSGGGVLTNWAIGHTDRFKAAVSQRSIADWRDFWYTADFALFQPTWFRAAPWEDEADFKARSPITYIDKIKTPLMLIEGEADMRTPSGAGGEQMFRALKYRHIPTAMVQFPGETHELSRSGKPKHRIERLQHIVAWFDKYLMGADIKTYDIE